MTFCRLRDWFRSRFSRKKRAKGGISSLFCCMTFTNEDDCSELIEDAEQPIHDRGDFVPTKKNLAENSLPDGAKQHAKWCRSKCFLRKLARFERIECTCPCPIEEIDETKMIQLPDYPKRRRKISSRCVDAKYIETKMVALSQLGAGGFGCVYLVRDLQRGIDLATKVISVKTSSDEMVKNELKILQTVKENPFCVQYDSYVKYQVSSDVQKHFLFFEHFQSVTLRQFPTFYRINTHVIRLILGQMGMALKYLHGKNIIHRDIKGDNVLINDQCKIKVIDFGLSAIGTSFKGYCGTPYYVAPEVQIHCVEKNAKPYSFAADYYSLGITAYQLIYGISPCKYKLKLLGLKDNDSACRKLAFREIAAGRTDFPLDLDASRQDLVRKLLLKDPEQRLGDKTYLSHSFFEGKDLKKLLKYGLKVQKKYSPTDPEKTNIPIVEGKDKLPMLSPLLPTKG